MFFEPEIETMPRKELEKLQWERLTKTLKKAYQSPFYKKRMDSVSFHPEKIQTLEEFKTLPFTTKDDLRASYPYEMVVASREEVVRLHSSSGTTGQATVIFFTAHDLKEWTNLVSRSLYMIGMRKSDIFQNMMSYGLFTGGLGFHYGAENLGALVIPVGGGNTKKQISLIKDFSSNFLHITPSYALHVADVLESMKLKPSSLGLKGLVVGAEPHSEATRKKLEEIYQAPVFNSFGLSEMNGPGVGFECHLRQDIHIWEDNYLIEIIDPVSLKPVEAGQVGELVLTHLNRLGMPLLRYRTKDLTFLYPEPCACGRTHQRIGRIMGRSDDMMIIKGINVFPSQIEQVLMKIPEVGNNYQIVIDRGDDFLDRVTIKVEIVSKYFHGNLGELKRIKNHIRRSLKDEMMIQPEVDLLEPNTLPPSEGKAKRVVDLREI